MILRVLELCVAIQHSCTNSEKQNEVEEVKQQASTEASIEGHAGS